MKAWCVRPSDDLSGFELIDVAVAAPGPGEATVRLKALALNFRDFLVASGNYPKPLAYPLIPCSDGCWEVIAVGDGVTRVAPGDRVINCFLPEWRDGRLLPAMADNSYGGEIDGVLTQQRNIAAEALIKIPPSLTDAEAATLPCAGVTAWSALYEAGKALQPGETVLTIGTGGVSVLAAQLAKVGGARVIMLSSSDEKLAKLQSIGVVDGGVNYRTHPDWQHRVRDLTGGEGVDLVVEVGGPGTLAQSLAALRFGGRIALIGFLSDPTALIHPGPIVLANAAVNAVSVGSRTHTEALVRAVEVNNIKPVIHATYAFADAPKAIGEIIAGRHLGKLIVSGE